MENRRLSAFLFAIMALWLVLSAVSLAAPIQQGGIPTEEAAATFAPQPQPGETATPTPTGNSTICVNAFLDENGNGVHDANEGFVSGVTLTVAQNNAIIGQGVSTGSATPLCFNGLLPGFYQVAQSVPPTLEMTTQANATIQVGPDQTVGLEFGSRLRTIETPAPPAVPTEDLTSPTATAVPPTVAPDQPEGQVGFGIDPLVIIGLTAIAIGLILLGVLIYILLRR